MDNNKFPPLEPENHEPEVIPIIPERMEPLEDHPVIEELSFDQDTQPEKMPEDEITSSESLLRSLLLRKSPPLRFCRRNLSLMKSPSGKSGFPKNLSHRLLKSPFGFLLQTSATKFPRHNRSLLKRNRKR